MTVRFQIPVAKFATPVTSIRSASISIVSPSCTDEVPPVLRDLDHVSATTLYTTLPAVVGRRGGAVAPRVTVSVVVPPPAVTSICSFSTWIVWPLAIARVRDRIVVLGIRDVRRERDARVVGDLVRRRPESALDRDGRRVVHGRRGALAFTFRVMFGL